MQRKALAALTAAGLTAAIAIPAIAFGNARPGPASPNTAFVARLLGTNEVPSLTPGLETVDPDGFGSATVTFDLSTVGSENICWDLNYENLTGTPIMAHIHGPGVAGINAPVVIAFTPFSALGPTSSTGCRLLTAPEAVIAADMVANPTNYYVNVHTLDFPGGAIRGQLSAGRRRAVRPISCRSRCAPTTRGQPTAARSQRDPYRQSGHRRRWRWGGASRSPGRRHRCDS